MAGGVWQQPQEAQKPERPGWGCGVPMTQALVREDRGGFLGSALQALGLLQVPSSVASRKGPSPAALSPTSLPGAGRGPGREAVQKDHSPGVDGLDPSLISALTASPRASHTSL